MEIRPSRKRTRLVGYDYATPGAYFVTVCTAARRPILSSVRVGQGLAPATVHLSDYGLIAQKYLLEIPDRFPNIHIDRYVIMPNHIHILLSLSNFADKNAHASVIDAMRVFKSLTTRACKQHAPIKKVFQASYHDHIVRGREDYDSAWMYIDNNPIKWTQDRFYIE